MISDPEQSDAWAIYVTPASLRSAACQEELAYALDRALRSRGAQFPLIGIFPEPIDRALIPAAIAVRLYVDLRKPDWANTVAAGVLGHAPSGKPKGTEIAPFHFYCTQLGDQLVFEMRPRTGRWHPFVILIPNDERNRLQTIGYGPSGGPPEISMVLGTSEVEADGYSGLQMMSPVDALNSAYAYFSSSPREIAFGQRGETLVRIAPSEHKDLCD